jgi:thiaminase/transcriptional activator TenA
MAFSDELLEEGKDVWGAQKEHPFVVELARGELDEDAFLHWVKQDYRYLLDYARVFSVAGARARQEETMTRLMGIAHTVLDYEMDLHRDFAADYGLTPADLEAVEKAPTCVGYTNFLLRTAYEGSLAEIAAAIYPCGQGYLDVARHMENLAEKEGVGEHRYTPFIEKYTSEEFVDVVGWMTEFVDDCAERFPGEREAMRDAFVRSARLEHAFWDMCYTKEGWEV